MTEMAYDVSPQEAGNADSLDATQEMLVPISPQQTLICAVNEIMPNAMQNLSILLEIRGGLAIDTMCLALQSLLGKHPILRVKFIRVEGGWSQVVRGAGEAERLLEVAEVDTPTAFSEFLVKPFDLRNELLVRCCWAKIDVHFHKVALSFHRLVIDLASVKPLVAQLIKTYQDFRAKTCRPASYRADRYFDYCRWI